VSVGALERVIPGDAIEAARTATRTSADVFEAAYLRHYSRVVAVLFRLTGDRMRADELANEVFVDLYRRGGGLLTQNEFELGGWLNRTAVNLGIDALRTAARRRKYEGAAAADRHLGGPSSNPLDDVLREESRRRVQAVLARLKAAHTRILVLRASGLSYSELATALKVRVGAVGTMLARAEAAFEKCYRKLFPQEET
jgi:RNA polymerase sigma-70 factor, ECF subfamily